MRKKSIHTLLLTFIFLFAFCIPAFAEEWEDGTPVVETEGVSTENKVYDYADLLTEEEEADLQAKAETICSEWGMDLVFLTTYDTNGWSAQTYGAEFYRQNGFGVGSDYSGMIFIVDMGVRDAQMVTCGKAIDIFTDYYIEVIWEEMVDDLSDGYYYDAMYTLCFNVDYYNYEYQQYLADPDGYTSAYEKAQAQGAFLMRIVIALIFGLIVATTAVAYLKSQMNNVKPFTDGRAYLKDNGCRYSIDQSNFAGTHTTMVPIPKNDDKKGGSWGGGSSTFSRGGRSFGGGGGRF